MSFYGHQMSFAQFNNVVKWLTLRYLDGDGEFVVEVPLPAYNQQIVVADLSPENIEYLKAQYRKLTRPN